jgi:hypothetical protein
VNDRTLKIVGVVCLVALCVFWFLVAVVVGAGS